MKCVTVFDQKSTLLTLRSVDEENQLDHRQFCKIILDLHSNVFHSLLPEMPRLKNCWACDICSGSRTLKRGGVTHQAPKARDFKGGVGACSPEIFENLSLPKCLFPALLDKFRTSSILNFCSLTAFL